MDRIAGMQAFMALVEAGSFHAAARQLGLSRALVSKRVAALERELGVSLVQRTTRALSVTGPGAEFLEPCRQVLEAYEAATAGLARHQAEPRGCCGSTARCPSASCTWRRRCSTSRAAIPTSGSS
jgi:DNA-binding transcriptional LysR family regulator